MLVTFLAQRFFEINNSLNKKTALQRNIDEKIASPTDARNILRVCSLDNEPINTFNETNIAKRLIIVPTTRDNLIFIVTLHVM